MKGRQKATFLKKWAWSAAETYLKLKMCMLWSSGLSMPFVILHVYVKELSEEQVKTVLVFS